MSKCTLTLEALDEINEHFQNVFFETEANDLQNVLNQEINNLKENYIIRATSRDVTDLAEAIMSAAEMLDLHIYSKDTFSQQNIEALIRYVATNETPLSTKNVTEQLLDSQDATDKRKVNEAYLKDSYGVNDSVKKAAVQQVNNSLIDCLFLGRGNLSGVVSTKQQLNDNIRAYQEELFDIIQDYLINVQEVVDSSLEQDIYQFVDGKNVPTGAYETVIHIADAYLKPGSKISSDQLQSIATKALEGDKTAKTTLDAYNALVFLKNFDTHLRKTFGKALKIQHIGQKTGENKYSINSSKSNTATTFRENEPVVIDEVDSITKQIINTRPLFSGSTQLSGKYLTFQNFEHVVGKLKKLAINPDAAKVVFSGINLTEDYDYLDLDTSERNQILNKTLPDIIGEIRTHASTILPVLFKIFANPEFQRKNQFIKRAFKEDEIILINSIYKTIFDKSNTDSIISRSDANEGVNYYRYIVQQVDSIFETSFIQLRVASDGSLKTRVLTDNVVMQEEYNIRNIINNTFTSNLSPLYNENNIKEFFKELNIQPIIEGVKTTGVTFEIPSTIPDKKIKVSVDFNTQTVTFPEEIDYEAAIKTDVILDTVSKYTGLPLTIDSDLYRTLVEEYSSKSSLGSALLSLTSRIIANQWANKYIISQRVDRLDAVEQLFNKNTKIRYNASTKATNLETAYDAVIINKLAVAKAIISGQSTAIQVNDSQHASQSLQTTSKLTGAIKSQHRLVESALPNEYSEDEYGRKLDMGSPTRDFLLIQNPDIFINYHQFHEYYDPKGKAKKVIEFTTSELAYSSFMYNFVPSLYDDAEDAFKMIKAGKALFLASVNSDKSVIGYIESDLNTRVAVYDSKGYLTGTKKPLKDFTSDELDNLISHELGLYYQRMYEKIDNDFQGLSEYVSRTFLSELVQNHPELAGILSIEKFPGFSYGHNFKKFKEWFNFMSQSEVFSKLFPDENSFLQEATLSYNLKHRLSPIEIVDQIYTKGGSITRSNTLIAQLYTFNKNFLDENGIEYDLRDEKGNPIFKYYSSKEYWESANKDLLRTLLTSNFEVNLGAGSPRENILFKQYLADKYPRYDVDGKIIEGASDWITNDKYLILAKVYKTVTDEKGNIVLDEEGNAKRELIAEVSSIEDLARQIGKGLPTNFLARADIQVELNPVINQYNKLHYMITQEWQNSGVGTFLAHSDKSKSKDAVEQEASQFSAQNKRNVSWTAQMQQFLLGEINGVPEYYNIATIEDDTDSGIIIYTDDAKTKPYDGATFDNPFIAHLENLALGGQAVGSVKKCFGHAKIQQLGAGIIIKTANFPLTNDNMRNSFRLQNLMRKMTDIQWMNPDGSPAVVDILHDYKGDVIAYGNISDNPDECGIFFKDSTGRAYRVTQIRRNSDGTYTRTIQEVNIKNSDETIGEEFVEFDEVNGQQIPKTWTINSNYKLWQFFGAENSLEIVPNTTRLQPSENSIKMVVKAMNGCVVEGMYTDEEKSQFKTSKNITQQNVWQPLKHSDIHWLVTGGAIKQGAANINSKAKYDNAEPLNFQRVRMLQAGPQLDKEHHAENAEVNNPTQVISALAQTANTTNLANSVYKALNVLTNLATEKLSSELRDYVLTDSAKAKSAFAEEVSKLIISKLAKEDSDTLAEQLAADIVKQIKQGRLANYTSAVFPLSDSVVFNKAVSNFANYLSKEAIRLKSQGMLCVINPSFGTYKLYGDRKLESFNNPEVELAELQLQYDANPVYDVTKLPTGSVSNLEMHRVYNITYIGSDGSEQVTTKLLTPEFYERVKVGVRNGTITKIVENVIQGRELGAYNVRFLDTNGVQYQLWDIDSIKQKHKLLKIKEGDYESFKLWLQEIAKQYPIQCFLNPEKVKEYFTNSVLSGKLGPNVTDEQKNEAFIEWYNNPASENRTEIELESLGITVEASFTWGMVYAVADLNTAKSFFDKQVSKELERLSLNVVDKAASLITLENNLRNADNDQDLNLYYKQLQLWCKYNLFEDELYELSKIQENPKIQDLAPRLRDHIERQLDFINKSRALTHTVIIDGQKVQIDPKSIKTQAFELVAPKHWKTEFGFDTYTDLYSVKNDPNYFIKQYIENATIRKANVSEYDIVLLQQNGKHIYLIQGKNVPAGLIDITDSIDTVEENGVTYRIDEDGNILHKFTPGTRIFVNRQGTEIIATYDTEEQSSADSIKEYLNDFSYFDIDLSSQVEEREDIELLDILAESGAIDDLYDQAVYRAEETIEGYDPNNADRFILTGLFDILSEKKDILNLDKDNLNLDYVLENKFYSKVVNHGRAKYASFLKSLDMVAARIPAQALQSVMAMKIAAFANEDVNNAYVSNLQLFLQGSDLDIDSVTLLTYSLNNNGIIQLWSPYAKINTDYLDSSLKLAFPTGNRVEVVYMSENDTEAFINKYRSILVFDKDKIYLKPNALNNIRLVNEFLSETKVPELSIALAKRLKLNSNAFNTKIAKIIDRHNLYLSTVGNYKLRSILNNYIQKNLYDTIIDPANQLDAQISVDTVADKVKKYADKPDLQKQAARMNPANSFSLFEYIVGNQEGKDCIAKSASSVKGFFALLQYNNMVLNSGDAKQQDRLLRRQEEDYKNKFGFLLSNIKARDVNTITNEEVLDAILAIETDQDAVQLLSALLGLSADNAKELILSKINAGVDMIGMYLYGIVSGQDFNKLSNYMMSRTGQILRDLIKGDIFNGEKNYGRASSAFKYFTFDGLKRVLAPYKTYNFDQQLLKVVKQIETSKIEEDATLFSKLNDSENYVLNDWLDAIDKLRDKYKSDLVALQGLRQLRKYIYRYKSTNYKELMYLKKMAYGADEMVKLGSFIMNKDLPSKYDEILKKVIDFESLLIDETDKYEDYLSVDKNEKQKDVEFIDFQKFCIDSDYREKIIDKVDKVKHSINVLDSLSKNPHHFGYLQKLAELDKSLSERSYRYRSLKALYKQAKRENTYIDSDYLSSLSQFLTKTTINDWLLSSSLKKDRVEFILPKGNAYFSETGQLQVPLTEDVPLRLGTEAANQTFRMWVEREVIPNLKKGMLINNGETGNGEIVKNNLFIKDLIPGSRTNTVLGNISTMYTLPIDMMAKEGTYDADKKALYIEAFDKLGSFTYNNIPLKDIFLLYTMFAHDWKRSKNSLVGVLANSRSDGLYAEYAEYISTLDKSTKSLSDNISLKEQLIPYLAKKESYKTSTAGYIIYSEQNLGNVLYKRERLSQEEQNDGYQDPSRRGDYVIYTPDGTLDTNYFTAGIIPTNSKFVKESMRLGNETLSLYIQYTLDGIVEKVSVSNGKYPESIDPSELKIPKRETIRFKKIEGKKSCLVEPNIENIKRAVKARLGYKAEVRNNEKYKYLAKVTGVSENVLLGQIIEYLDNNGGTWPTIKDIEGSYSAPYVKSELEIDHNNNSTTVEKVLDFTKTDSIEKAIIKLNQEFPDVEYDLIQVDKKCILKTKERPSNYTPDVKFYEISNTIDASSKIAEKLNKLARIYGIQVSTVTSAEINTILNVNGNLVNAFIHNGHIYINSDHNLKDSTPHEMFHLFIGSMRFIDDETYTKLLELAKDLPGFEDYANRHKDMTRNNALEEYLVTQLGKYLVGEPSQIQELPEKLKNKILNNINDVLNSVLMGDFSVADVYNKYNRPFWELVRETNSDMLSNIYELGYKTSALHRRLNNVKMGLMHNNTLTETCD